MKVLLRVDIDFSFGIEKGVPWLLDRLKERNIKATFLSVMGPDTVGTHKKRVGKKGYLKRLIAMNPIKMLYHFGPLFFLRGSLLPIAYVGQSHPDILKRVVDEGHELGIHGYNHAEWADKWQSMDYAEVARHVELANAEFAKIMGHDTKLWGSPNWRTVEPLYQYLEGQHMTYTSNLRGNIPFFPQYGERRYNVLELPINLPALHEMVQLGIKKRAVPGRFAACLRPDYNMWVIHCYYEGILERKLFLDTLDAALDAGASFETFGSLAQAYPHATEDGVGIIEVPGGFGAVSCQQSFVCDNYFKKLMV